MAVHQIDKKDDYLKFLQQKPTEVEELFRDVLIGVTSFFRDPEAFDIREEVIYKNQRPPINELIPSDIGRPVGHIVPNLKDYNHLVEDAQTVLVMLIPIEIEVETMEEKYYTMLILPYRT